MRRPDDTARPFPPAAAEGPGRPPKHHVDLVSHWRLQAAPQQVWAALTDTGQWPRWWPYVRRVQTLAPGGAAGVACVQRIDCSTRLPCRISIDVEAIESLPPERLRVRSRGALSGEAIWLLRADGRYTDVTSLWRVDVQQRWMRVLTPLVTLLLRWNHHGVMRAGGAGLARHLQAGTIRR